MYIDMMQQIYNNVSKVMIDTRNSNQLLYLPLDKIIQQTSSGDGQVNPGVPSGINPGAQPPSGSVTVPLNPSSNLGVNSVPQNSGNLPQDKRETFRSRERDLR